MKLISIIIPVYNEEKNVPLVYVELKKIITKFAGKYVFEMTFVNDGSADGTLAEVEKIMQLDPSVRLIDFSRNFGKEEATTAGIHHCKGEACIVIDADLQHPIDRIPEFITKWEAGAEMVIGIRERNKGEGLIKKWGSAVFNAIMTFISEHGSVSGSTDFRLIDRIVIDEFNRLTEHERITRGLLDWLGFRREYIHFQANERASGKASYSTAKLLKLAFSSFISQSLFPLKIAGYLGILITLTSGILGLFIFIEQYIFKDPYGLNFSGPAILAVILLFLVGIILICLGLIALYIGSIHKDVSNRPLYVVRKRNTRN